MVLNLLFKEQITETDLATLKGLPCETELLDVKSHTYTVKPPDTWKQEICEDISAFANARGGLILLGVAEGANGRIGDAVGLGTGFNADNEIKQLKQAADSGLEPIVPGLRFQAISLGNDTNVAIAIHIPRSIAAPHKVVRLPPRTSGSYQVFKIRRSNGNADMSLDELRLSFSLADSFAAHTRQFRRHRIEVINNVVHDEYTPMHLSDGAKIALHVIPLGASDPSTTIDLAAIRSGRYISRDQWFHRIGYSYFNFEGLLIPGGSGEMADEYTQVFRNGIVETVEVIEPRIRSDITFLTFSQVEASVLHNVRRSLALLRQANVPSPLYIFLSILNAKGFRLIQANELDFGQLPRFLPPEIRNNLLLFPEVEYESFAKDYKDALKPVLDSLWNTGAEARSLSYNAQGKWDWHIDED